MTCFGPLHTQNSLSVEYMSRHNEGKRKGRKKGVKGGRKDEKK
jgi:hypothetical protein